MHERLATGHERLGHPAVRDDAAERCVPGRDALAKVIMSGTTPYRSEANQWPTRPKPVMTSSATSSTPYLSHSARSPGQ